MLTVKVLALNDDNHERCYATKRDLFSNCASFAKELLLNSHMEQYEVREVAIIYPQGALAEMNEDEFNRLFDLLACEDPDRLAEGRPDLYKERQAAFDLFWENGEEWRYA